MSPSQDGSARDAESALIEQVRAAQASGQPLRIRGGDTKAFYGHPVAAATILETAGHQGIVAYEPTELAVTVRCGTRLAELEALLASADQHLPFEPPAFGAAATVGGMVAAGLSGPRRPYAASLRDAVLGVRLLNGRGEALDFGGRVMKNVAGYDVSRLMAGALGVLGVLLEVSLKVAPRPASSQTLVQEASLDAALERCRAWSRRALPITATAWHAGWLRVRLCGSDEAVAEAGRELGGEPMPDSEAMAFWRDLREQRLDFFAAPSSLWRLSVAPASGPLALPGEDRTPPLIEWGGALRWSYTSADPERVRALARAAGGHATLFRAAGNPAGNPTGGPPVPVFTPLDPVPLRLHRRLKAAFDPQGLFNPGRLYPEV